MIDRVYFECGGVSVAPYEDFGMFLKSFDAPTPEAKVYRMNLEGMDGALDMSEWAGEVKYNNRNVTIAMLDFGHNYRALKQIIAGRKCKIWKSDEPEYYYEGRCDTMPDETRKRVTNMTLNFVCSPWKMHKTETKLSQTVTTSGNIYLRAERKTVIPTVTLSAGMTLTWNGASHTEESAGSYNWPWLVVTDAGGTLGISGNGTITLAWRDGVL